MQHNHCWHHPGCQRKAEIRTYKIEFMWPMNSCARIIRDLSYPENLPSCHKVTAGMQPSLQHYFYFYFFYNNHFCTALKHQHFIHPPKLNPWCLDQSKAEHQALLWHPLNNKEPTEHCTPKKSTGQGAPTPNRSVPQHLLISPLRALLSWYRSSAHPAGSQNRTLKQPDAAIPAHHS